jgi:hypothetical protein
MAEPITSLVKNASKALANFQERQGSYFAVRK